MAGTGSIGGKTGAVGLPSIGHRRDDRSTVCVCDKLRGAGDVAPSTGPLDTATWRGVFDGIMVAHRCSNSSEGCRHSVDTIGTRYRLVSTGKWLEPALVCAPPSTSLWPQIARSPARPRPSDRLWSAWRGGRGSGSCEWRAMRGCTRPHAAEACSWFFWQVFSVGFFCPNLGVQKSDDLNVKKKS